MRSALESRTGILVLRKLSFHFLQCTSRSLLKAKSRCAVFTLRQCALDWQIATRFASALCMTFAVKGEVMRASFLLLSTVIGSACSTAPHQYDGFTGTWVGNEAESVMLPGQHVPKNMIGIMEDNGHFLRTA